MPDKNDKWPDNAPGKFYVDKTCIACDACVMTAPENFKMDQENGHAFLAKQPTGKEQEDKCREAMEGCPVEAIGNDNE